MVQAPVPPLDVAAELNHQIKSPLAAIRNALYLAASRSHDPEILRYLTLAEHEAVAIAAILDEARCPPPRRLAATATVLWTHAALF